MRFGAQTVQQNVRWPQLLDFWSFLEEQTCIDSIWAMDHLVVPIGDQLPEVACFESWTLLAAAAQATHRLRIGCLVSANTFRHPALLQLVFTSEKPASFRGKHYRLENAPFLPGFVQEPHPPLMIGGGGEKRTLRTAARYAELGVSEIIFPAPGPWNLEPGGVPLSGRSGDPSAGDQTGLRGVR